MGWRRSYKVHLVRIRGWQRSARGRRYSRWIVFSLYVVLVCLVVWNACSALTLTI